MYVWSIQNRIKYVNVMLVYDFSNRQRWIIFLNIALLWPLFGFERGILHIVKAYRMLNVDKNDAACRIALSIQSTRLCRIVKFQFSLVSFAQSYVVHMLFECSLAGKFENCGSMNLHSKSNPKRLSEYIFQLASYVFVLINRYSYKICTL